VLRIVTIVALGAAAGALALALLILIWSVPVHRHPAPVTPRPFSSVTHPHTPVPKTTPARCGTFRLVTPGKSGGGFTKARMTCPGRVAGVA
jgi:hypothetical protein